MFYSRRHHDWIRVCAKPVEYGYNANLVHETRFKALIGPNNLGFSKPVKGLKNVDPPRRYG
ncbi:MAG: hypothetical protein WA138_15295, partial [Parvibaculum sp.]